jgi:hypothetical protein
MHRRGDRHPVSRPSLADARLTDARLLGVDRRRRAPAGARRPGGGAADHGWPGRSRIPEPGRGGRLPDGSRTVRGYRTGDRGRRDRAGQLEFLGRTDSQVSIAGHRVEIGEVETVLRGCPGVRAAAVGTRRDGHETTLAAYVILESAAAIGDVRTRLAAALPPHMIPAITVVPEIPMGPTGKADFARIAEVSGMKAEKPPEKTAPGSATGASVADIVQKVWCETLEVTTVEATDDFFSLGGDSVKATRTIVAIREILAPDIPIRALFDHPAFHDFCAVVAAYPQCGMSASAEPA